jgi:hypothetical protein
MEAQGSSPLTLGDQDNIMALLKLPARLREIQLTVTTAQLRTVNILMRQQRFSQLESLLLTTLDGLVLPTEFGGGMPRLRSLRTVWLALPALPQLLLSSHDLVTLWLDKIPCVGYTLEALIICLPGMTQLKTLRIHFLSPSFRPVLIRTDRPLSGFSVLPVLNFIEFRGTSEHLESLLSGISAPHLEQFLIDFFDQGSFDTPHLSRFTRCTEMQRSISHAIIISSPSDISIAVAQESRQLLLRILCKQLHRRIRSMAEVCDRLFHTLADVEQLEIVASASSQGNMDHIHAGTLDLLRPFRSVRRLCLSKSSLSLVSGALGLVPKELAAVTLPELEKVQLKNYAELTSPKWGLSQFSAWRQREVHVFSAPFSPPRVRFMGDPIMDLPSLSALSDSDPATNTPPPASPISSSPWERPYVPKPPLPPLTPRASVYLEYERQAPRLKYDVRFYPKKPNLHLSQATLALPATRPPFPSLPIRVQNLPWDYFIVRPDPRLLREKAVVTIQDVLFALYSYLRKEVNADEYNAMTMVSRAVISRTFERRVRYDPDQRGKGLRRVDFLGRQVQAQGLVRAQLQNDVWVWEVVLR